MINYYKNYKYLRTINSQINWLDQNISDQEIEAVRFYTSAYGYKINKNLRNNQENKDYQNTIAIIDNLFEKIPATNQSIIVYRNIDEEYKTYISNAYTSTTTDLNTLVDINIPITQNNDCILEITISSGIKILPIAKYSEHPSELEILLPRNINLSITNKTTKYGVTYIYITCIPNNYIEINQIDESKIVYNNLENILNLTLKNLEFLYQENLELDGTYQDFLELIEIYIIEILKKYNMDLNNINSILNNEKIIENINSFVFN